jgi:hypothetical protein
MPAGVSPGRAHPHNVCRLCMGLYTETWSADNVTDDQVKRWMDKYHIHIVSTFLNHKDYRPGLSCKLSCTTSGLVTYGLSYHDLEWFSRGVLVTAVLKVNQITCIVRCLCTKMMPTRIKTTTCLVEAHVADDCQMLGVHSTLTLFLLAC